MSRVNVPAEFGSTWSKLTSTRLLASAQSCAERIQLSLEGLGSVSNLFVLTGVGAGLLVSCLSGLTMDRSLSVASNGVMRKASRLAGGVSIAVDMA
jgi:hypothetical protein